MATLEEKYRTLIELAPDPIFLVDPSSGSVVETNERAATLLGYEQSALERMNLRELHPSSDTEAYRSLFERTLEEDVVRTDTLPDGGQLHLLTRAGERVPVELHAKTVAVDGDTWIYGIARDISERREREEALERKNDRLDQFASVVSHDLRNPLNVADGRLELAREERDSDHLETVARSLDRMSELIDDLLGLARADEGVDELEWVALAEVSRNCWRNVDTSAASIEVEGDHSIYADRTRLRQLFENLIRNAVEHGGDSVTIAVGDRESGFYVEDDGPGIPPDERDRVFEAGYSTEAGTGLGLSIVSRVVEAHGWAVRVTERTGGGTRIEVTGVETR